MANIKNIVVAATVTGISAITVGIILKCKSNEQADIETLEQIADVASAVTTLDEVHQLLDYANSIRKDHRHSKRINELYAEVVAKYEEIGGDILYKTTQDKIKTENGGKDGVELLREKLQGMMSGDKAEEKKEA